MSLFSAVEMAPRDPILGLNEQFAADTNPAKVNLGVGVYFDDNGKLPLLQCVQAAEKAMMDKPTARGYLPIDGIAAYDAAVKGLVFGADSDVVKSGRVATVQAIGGTGGLKIGAEHQGLHACIVGSNAVDGQVATGGGFFHHGFFSRLNALQQRQLAVVVEIHAHAEVDLVGVGVGVELLVEAQDGVVGGHFDGGETARLAPWGILVANFPGGVRQGPPEAGEPVQRGGCGQAGGSLLLNT